MIRFPVPQPGKLKLKAGLAVGEVGENKAAVLCLLPAGFLESKGFLIETQGFLQIDYIVIVVRKLKIHCIFLLSAIHICR